MNMAAPVASEAGHFLSATPFRPSFLQSPGTPPIPWTRWRLMFEDWLVAIGFPATAAFAVRKAALLRASLGVEGARIYYSLAAAEAEEYATVVGRLNGHFGRPSGVIFNRAQFTRHLQRPGDTIVQFLSTLRELAKKCNYPEEQFDERVRDQFAAGCCSDKIRERLLQEPETKSLDDLVSLAATMERALLEAPALMSGRVSSDVAVATVDKAAFRQGRWKYQSPSRSSTSRFSTSGTICANCGRQGHSAYDSKCVAREAVCHGCGRVGHFRAQCRTSKPSGRGRGRQGRSSSSYRRNTAGTNSVDSTSACDDDVLTVTVSAINSTNRSTWSKASQFTSPGRFKTVICEINGEPLELLVDLGARVSVLNRQFYNRALRKLQLTPSDVVLHGYGGPTIPCKGCVHASVRVNNCWLQNFRFYITENGPSVMGVDLFDALGGVASVAGSVLPTSLTSSVAAVTVDQVQSSSSVCLEQYPVLLKQSGTLTGFVHKPLVDDTVTPVRQKFWHPPLAKREPIANELRRLEQDGVIERVDASSWTSNILTVPKKDGSLRLCVNLTDVNRAIIPERYPLPTMDELTETIAGSVVFSKIDLLWGYLQLELAEESRYLTAFVTHIGVFRFRSLPFGLASGPSAFHQVIQKIIEGLDGCVNILDDILLYARSMAEHDERLRRLLERLSKYNATVRKDKCIIGASEVDFNGHRISASGILPLSSNVDAIQRIPVPEDPRQLSRFVSTAAYYLKFVPEFAELCDPLRQLLRADAVWNWSPTCQANFEELKHRIQSPPVLAHFDVNLPTIVTCDASAVAIGATLSQRHRDSERPVAFASRTLSPAERRYSASERESLACLWACEHWHFYLYGRKFTLVTDHQALKTLLTSGGTGHRPLRLHRWADRLFQYDFSVVYRPGKLNIVADCLSRAFPVPRPRLLPPAPPGEVSPAVVDEDDVMIQTIFGHLATSVVTLDMVVAATDTDVELQQIMQFVVQGWPAKKNMPPTTSPFFQVRDELSLVASGRCLLRETRIVVPAALRRRLLELAHEGHPGISRMKSKCREAIWWPGIDADVERFVRDCQPCIVSGKSLRPSAGPLLPVPRPDVAWRKISLDIAGEFVAAPTQHRYMIVAIDYHSKWPETATCSRVTSSAVIDFLNQIFDRFGLVEEIVTDNGAQFVSSEFESYLLSHGIRHSRSALYSPQANAEVERFNRVMKEGVRTGLADGQTFLTSVRHVLASYRMTPQTTTGVTPASLMLSFPVRTPLTLLPQSVRSSSSTTSRSSLPSSSPPSTVLSSSSVASRVRFAQQNMAQYHDQRHHARPSLFVAGDMVRYQLPNRPHKLSPVYSGPVQVSKASGNTVWLTNGQRWNVRRCILHRSSLKSTVTSSSSSASPSSPMSAPASDTAKINNNNSDGDDDDNDDLPRSQFCMHSHQQQHQQHQTVRRSQRRRVQRDFGPVISY